MGCLKVLNWDFNKNLMHPPIHLSKKLALRIYNSQKYSIEYLREYVRTFIKRNLRRLWYK